MVNWWQLRIRVPYTIELRPNCLTCLINESIKTTRTSQCLTGWLTNISLGQYRSTTNPYWCVEECEGKWDFFLDISSVWEIVLVCVVLFWYVKVSKDITLIREGACDIISVRASALDFISSVWEHMKLSNQCVIAYWCLNQHVKEIQ